MTITAEVKGCTISLRQPPLAGGTVGDVTVEFHFDEVWNGYTRTAVFRAHGKTVLMLLASDRCTLPPEATAGGDVLLGVFGVCGEKTLTTPFCRLAVAQGVPTAGDMSTGVTPTLAAQLLAAYGRLTAATAEAAGGDTAAVTVTEGESALHFAFTLPRGAKGDKGDKGDDSDVTAAGYNTFTGTNTFNGKVTVSSAPTADNDVANKKYVDEHSGGDYVLTDADKSEIAALVLAQIPDGDEVAYG